eukprot:g17162.t1
MEPGRIGDEFFMTRGHIHATANRPETYYGETGEGLMLMESPDGQVTILEVRPKVLVYVPPMWIHRSVNTGDTPLVMSFCYPSDSGQDYEVIARSGGMAVRIVAGELQLALKLECEMVKFFPAAPAGGPAMLKAIAGPYAHTGIGFNPTGGVTLDNLSDWLSVPQPRLDHIRSIHGALGSDVPVDYVLAPTAQDNDAILSSLRPGSLVINATGLGKDAPGSPLTHQAKFPDNGIVWELNYRGDLVFLDQATTQAEARKLQVEDGWTYFIHGWTQRLASGIPGNFTLEEAINLCKDAGIGWMIPHHFGMFAFNTISEAAIDDAATVTFPTIVKPVVGERLDLEFDGRAGSASRNH